MVTKTLRNVSNRNPNAGASFSNVKFELADGGVGGDDERKEEQEEDEDEKERE